MAWYREWGWLHRLKNLVAMRSTGRVIHHTSKAAHRLLALGTSLLVLASLALAVAAWRLAQGPIDLGGWSSHVRSAFVDDTAPVRVSFNRVYLAWEGFHKGVDHPLDLRLSDITVTDWSGRRLVAAPSAYVTFSFAGLLLGRVIPRAIEVDHAQVAITRTASGISEFGRDLTKGSSNGSGQIDLQRFRRQISQPARSDHNHSAGIFDQIRRVHFRSTDLVLRDQESGLLIEASDMDLDLVRARTGHLHGLLQAPLSIGSEHAALTANADWTPGSDPTVDLTLAPIRPARVGHLPSMVAFMSAIDVPISITAVLRLNKNFDLSEVRTHLYVGRGHIQVGLGNLPVRSGIIVLSAKHNELSITNGHFDVAHTPQARPEIIDVSGTVSRTSRRLTTALTVKLGQIDIVDLSRLWPIGLGNSARSWVIEHVTKGIMTGGTAFFVMEADDSLCNVVLTRAEGELDGSNGTFTWIANMPPVERTDFHLHLVDLDTLDIRVPSAYQRIGSGTADLLVRNGQMRITGLSHRDQAAMIQVQLEGPVASALALLKEPRLHLLSAHPLAFRTGDGEASARINFQFPLEDNLQMDDVRLQADAHLSGIRLPEVAVGQDLDDGIFDISIDKEGSRLKGRGTLASIPVNIVGVMDFKPGAANQLVQQISIMGQPEAAQLDLVGLPVTDFMSGPVPATIVVQTRRDGENSIAISANLSMATLTVGSLGWTKSSGIVANASATILTSRERLTKIDKITVRGDGLALLGSADFNRGRLRTILLDEIRLGQTHGHGSIHFAPNGLVAVVLQGDRIDLSSELTGRKAAKRSDIAQATAPDWTLSAHFDDAILANGEHAHDVLAKATGGGQTLCLLDVVASTPGRSDLSVKIESQGDHRHLLVDATDAGGFLRGMDVTYGLNSGHLRIDGNLNSPFGLHPLAGTAVIDGAVVQSSPILGKLLQAITLYGLVDALSEPGMTFSHVVVPFCYNGTDVDVDGASAYNASLGLTATGQIDVSTGKTSVYGTIVPAYFFNSMLGKLPLVGKLFSPEKGGGVFAARFRLNGQSKGYSISINPISALTPGLLRQIFGVFGPKRAGEGSVTRNCR